MRGHPILVTTCLVCAACGRARYDAVDGAADGDAAIDAAAADAPADAGAPTTTDLAPVYSVRGTSPTAELGSSIAAADVNRDGRSDLIVGSPGHDEPSVGDDAGRVSVFLSGPAGLSTSPAIELTPSDGAGSLFGGALAGLGDVNGDGLEDVAVAAPYFTGTFERQGQVLVLAGAGATGLGETLWAASPSPARTVFGQEVVRMGDVTGDGLDDLAVAAPAERVGAGIGGVYVYAQTGTGFADAPIGRLAAPDPDGTAFGYSLAGGDLDGAPGVELVLGAYTWGPASPTGRHRGAVYGSTFDGAPSVIGPRLPTTDGDANVGSDIAVGQLLGDGRADVAVGAFHEATGDGAVYVYPDGSLLAGAPPPLRLAAPVPVARFGTRLAVADVDADGLDELLVGAYAVDGSAGAVYVYSLARDGSEAPPRWRLTGAPAGAQLGSALVAADLDGDGDDEGAGRAYRPAGGLGPLPVLDPP